MSDKPITPPANDGIYPRCVWCGSEIYAPAVIDYSEGKAVPACCNKPLPREYIKLQEDKQSE
jgi:hypothetical protein